MKSGYESLSWLYDKEGREYVCNVTDKDQNVLFEDLTEEEKHRCANVSQIVGTERW